MDCWPISAETNDGKILIYAVSERGNTLTLSDIFLPSFRLICNEPEYAESILSQHPHVHSITIDERFASIHDEKKTKMLKISFRTAGDGAAILRDLPRLGIALRTAQTAVPPYLEYMCEKGFTFFQKTKITQDNQTLSYASIPSYDEPPLSFLAAAWEGDLIKTFDGARTSLLSPSSFIRHLRANKPHVLFTFGGDDWLPRFGISRTASGVFFTLPIHVDLEKDRGFDIYSEEPQTAANAPRLPDLLSAGKRRFLRVIELSRMTCALPETVCRVTPGRLNTYLHMFSAWKMGHIVPDNRLEIESPKTLSQLCAMDKGGSIIYPTPGICRNVAKCDFASMYPNIIVNYNLSAETLSPKHECKNFRTLPNGWKICLCRPGIIPSGIDAVLKRRLALKKAARCSENPAARHSLTLRQKALKNILVTCFGYLGFNNFIFSNAQCKECVMYLGREILADAKTTAEKYGFRVEYGIVDSLFLSGGDAKTYAQFAGEVSRASGIDLELDCIFTHLAFPSSSSGVGIANKYFGITQDGEIEARGIAIRRSDSPLIAKNFQKEAIAVIFSEDEEKNSALASLKSSYVEKIRSRAFPLSDFVIEARVRREKYAHNLAHVIAYRGQPVKDGTSRFVFSVFGPKYFGAAHLEEISIPDYEKILSRTLEQLTDGTLSD